MKASQCLEAMSRARGQDEYKTDSDKKKQQKNNFLPPQLASVLLLCMNTIISQIWCRMSVGLDLTGVAGLAAEQKAAVSLLESNIKVGYTLPHQNVHHS